MPTPHFFRKYAHPPPSLNQLSAASDKAYHISGSRIRTKDQDQGSGSRIRIKDQDQGKEESHAPSQPHLEEQLDCRGSSRTSTNLQQLQGLVRYFENPTKMTAVIQRTFGEHHNSSKYLHWCTGLACGNLLFPPIWYFAILHGGWLWKQRCFHIFHTTKWHPSDGPGMRERKSICLYIGVICNNAMTIHL